MWVEHTSWSRLQDSQCVAASLLPLCDRIRRRRLRAALIKWRRRSQILSAQHRWKRAIERHRHYLLRKLVLRTLWRQIEWAFDHWVLLVRLFVRVGERLAQWRQLQCVRLAWFKWQKFIRIERLDEEVSACRCVLWTRKLDHIVQRSTVRGERERLVLSWILWKNWYRQERCKAWRRGIAFALRKSFLAWKRYSAAIRSYRADIQAMVLAIFSRVVDDSMAQCLWRENVQARRHTDVVTQLQRILQRWSDRIQHQRLSHAFMTWQSLLVDDVVVPKVISLPVSRMPTFPERVSATYRINGRKAPVPSRVYRPSWR